MNTELTVKVNDENLKFAWDAILQLEKWKGMDLPKDPETIALADQRIYDIKMGIRKHYRKQAEMLERRYFDSESTGYYRIFSETDYKSVDEAEARHQPLTCYPDQLGRWFEISHKFFKRSDGKVCGYAWMAMNW